MVSDLRYRSLFKVYLLLIAAALTCIGLMNLVERNVWAMGDWAINYSGGFVRRGLIGELALLLSRTLHANLFVVLLIVQWACYAALIWSVWTFVKELAWSFWMILLVYSPATLSLILLNPGAAFRKEILFETMLAVAIFLSDRFKLSGVMGQVMVPAAVFLAVLSHEALALFLPYLLALFLIRLRGTLWRGLIAFIPAALAGMTAFLIASQHPGNAADASMICSSVGGGVDPAIGLCRGAILYLSRDKVFAHRDVIGAIHYWHLVYQAPYIILLAAIPIVMALAELWRANRFECEVVASCAIAAWLATIPLFDYGLDWDRWVGIHAFNSMLLILMIQRRRQQTTKQSAATSWKLPARPASRYPAMAFLAFMTVGWQCAFTHHFPLPLDKLRDYVRTSMFIANELRNSRVQETPPADLNRSQPDAKIAPHAR